MSNQKMPLKALMRALSEAAVYANKMLNLDYAATVAKEADNKQAAFAPQPLCVSSMRVSFSAYMSEAEQANSESGEYDVRLDFDGPTNNFNGEIVFQPYTPEDGYTLDSEDSPCCGMTEQYNNAAEGGTQEHNTEKHYYI